jgi:hypothetical protein
MQDDTIRRDPAVNQTHHPLFLRRLGSQCPRHLRELRKKRGIFQPDFVIDGRGSADQSACRNVICNAALGCDDGSFADLAVADHSHLTSQNHAVGDFGGTAEADLGAEQGVFADLGSVADLHQVVDLDSAPDAGFANAGTVNAGVCLDFDVVFDDDWGGLGNLVPASIMSFGEAEAVGADDDAILQQNVVADAASFPDYGVGVREEVIADSYSAIEDDVRQQDGVVADLDILVNDYERADVSAASNLGSGMDGRRGVYSGGVEWRLVEQVESASETEVRILHAQRCRWDHGEGHRNDHCSSPGDARRRGIFRVRDERDFRGPGLLDAVEAGDLGIGGAIVEACVEGGGELREFHG